MPCGGSRTNGAHPVDFGIPVRRHALHCIDLLDSGKGIVFGIDLSCYVGLGGNFIV